ncbi:DUF1905 domain-containing protein [Candidatus Woesebacteria bacterium]|nr:DUF1905 domain-containing protein [Candidatus Woesebacteria bacterium]
MIKKYNLKEKIWLYPGKAGWYFITIPIEVSSDIDFFFSQQKRGWGSLRVKVEIGQTSWMTSIFPDKKSNSYLLPIKAEVRTKEGLKENSLVEFALEIAA